MAQRCSDNRGPTVFGCLKHSREKLLWFLSKHRDNVTMNELKLLAIIVILTINLSFPIRFITKKQQLKGLARYTAYITSPQHGWLGNWQIKLVPIISSYV